ncbi:MBOAT family O-acyltransferase [Faecalibacter macacae]|nr:MBOAT family O-acyltransferase [Faecalibacter macacae]
MNLEEYTYYRTGSTKIPVVIRNMFFKPFISSSLKSFWKFWNPTWGYFLLFYCYKPIKTIFPAWVALIATFIVSGLAHDIIYIIPMMIKEIKFVFPFITVWFFIISIGILLSEYLQINFRKTNLKFRPIFHLSYLIITFILTRFIDLLIAKLI